MVEGESVTVGESEDGVDMRNMMEETEMEEREEDEERKGERRYRSKREGMTRTMKGKLLPLRHRRL